MSKDLKLKDLVLEHYRKVYETEMDGMTIRVWKPKTMGKLPTYAMRTDLEHRAQDAKFFVRPRKVEWLLGNPDYGVWDAQLVRRYDPRTNTLDIYFAAIIVRPFSRQSYEWYEAHSMVCDPVARLCLMWDSREFDRNGGFDTSFGSYTNQKEVDKYIYSGKNAGGFEAINDPAFDPCPDEHGTVPNGFVMKFRVKDENIETETTMPVDAEMVDKMQQYLEPMLNNFLDFNKAHPDVPEIHYFTELTTWEQDEEEKVEE